MPIARALLSVSDKHGLADFARALARRGVELLSTGGSAQQLRNAGLEVREVADYTGFPEIMDGRVKTLHPRVHGGLLGRRGTDEAVMRAHGIEAIDLLVVNLYPFAATIARPDCTYAEAIENIDVGGPAMLRAAAKNHADVTVVVDPADYATVLAELAASGDTSIDTRSRLAAKAYAHTAEYDACVSAYLQRAQQPALERFPQRLPLLLTRVQELRYGENPHQRAAFYRTSGTSGTSGAAGTAGARGGSLAAARMLQGKELSFNNIADADTAIECVRQFHAPACVIVKHANPCGVAVRARPHRGLPARAPHRSDLGLRRHHRLQPHRRCRHRALHPGAAVRRGDRGTGLRRRGARRAGGQAGYPRARARRAGRGLKR